MIDWNENDKPPADIGELWARMNRLVRSLKDIVIIEDKLITVGAVGTLIAHGQGKRPRAAVAYLAPKTTSTNPPVVTEVTDRHVRVLVGGSDCRANILLVL